MFEKKNKNIIYFLCFRVKKWYWAPYAWFLNICMVQAWRLYRAHQKEENRLVQEAEERRDAIREARMLADGHSRAEVDKDKKGREKEKKRRRTEEKKTSEIPLLEFTRQVVEVTFKKHSDNADNHIPQRQAAARLTPAALATIRYDGGRHLVKLTTTAGVCQECKKRSRFRCDRCGVALHAECFFSFHQQGEI
jgi:hypothetical protein